MCWPTGLELFVSREVEKVRGVPVLWFHSGSGAVFGLGLWLWCGLLSTFEFDLVTCSTSPPTWTWPAEHLLTTTCMDYFYVNFPDVAFIRKLLGGPGLWQTNFSFESLGNAYPHVYSEYMTWTFFIEMLDVRQDNPNSWCKARQDLPRQAPKSLPFFFEIIS